MGRADSSRRSVWTGCLVLLLSAPACCLSEISGVGDGGPGSSSGSSTGAASSSAGSSTGGSSSGVVGTTGTSGGATSSGATSSGTAAATSGSTGGLPGAPDAGYGACGAGSELTSNATFPIQVWPWVAEESADMNGDGFLDMVEMNQEQGFDIWFGLADGGMGSRVWYTTQWQGMVVGDMNGDGAPDIVGWTFGGLFSVWLNDGKGGMTLAPGTAQASSFPNQVALGDLNGDGRGDIVASQSNQLEIVLADDAGGFAAPFDLVQASSGEWSSRALLAADLNGDGLADIVSNTVDQQKLLVLLSKGDGGFDAATYDPPATNVISLLPNGTKTPDLVAGLDPPGSPYVISILGFAVFHNRGDGTFEAGQSLTALGYFLAIGDFNGDCVTDIAVTADNNLGCQAGWGTTVFYGDGDGGFGGSQFLPAPGEGPFGPWALGRVDHPTLIGTTDYCGDGGFTIYGTLDP